MTTQYLLTGTTLIASRTGSSISLPITNVAAGETLVGIDVRPQNGFLYALGVNPVTDTATLYSLSTRTGFAQAVGTPGQIALATGGGVPIDLPDPATSRYGFDFNPANDRIRVITETGLNFRVNPNTGGAVDGEILVPGISPDGNIPAGNAIGAAAYTNNFPNNGGVTTLYTLDSANNRLQIQNPPNSGTQTSSIAITLGGSPLDFSAASFDILPGVNAPSSNAPATGTGQAMLTVGGVTNLYDINLATGAATLVGAPLPFNISGFTQRTDVFSLPMIGLTADGVSLIRFSAATPGTTTTLNISGVAPTDKLVGIDFRPQTGQLYGLGVNAGADTYRLYLIDPQTGAAIPVGADISVPGLPAGGYGFDFNPTVDRIRVTTDSGLNFRINPNSGALSATDTPINGSGVTGVSAAAYTNSYTQPLTGGVTTLYTLDAVSNALYIQNPPNGGVQTTKVPITLIGAPLDFTTSSGFDIPGAVTVITSNAVATGFGFAVLTVGGVESLYSIDLATGVANNLGGIGAGFTAMAGLAIGDATAVNPFRGTSGADTLTSYVGDATYDGLGGVDTINYSFNTAAQGVAVFLGRPDISSNDGRGGKDVLLGIENANGGAGGDTIVGANAGEGNLLNGNGGVDFLFGGGFAAGGAFAANSGADTLNGGAGNDGLWGADGADVLNGGGDSDSLVGGAGDDTLNGDDGNDFIFGGDFSPVTGGRLPESGADTINGGIGTDALYGFDGADTINGDAGDDYVEAGEGADLVNGGAGNDTLLGQEDADRINGGAGFDYMYGGAGGDTFVFKKGDSYDNVWDFSFAAGDRLSIDPALASSFAVFQSRLSGFVFNGANYTVFTSADGLDQLTIQGLKVSDVTAAILVA